VTAIERILSKLLGGDVSEANDGHGLGCSCPKHKAEREERTRRMLREGPEPGTVGAVLAEELRRPSRPT
jgi:hypothetical protein